MKTSKYLFALAIAGTLLTACADNNDLNVKATQTEAEEMPIGFDTYLSGNSTGSTRAYAGGLFKSADLKTDGFGIFAYLHNAKWGDIAPASLPTPNFMYNQKVAFDATASVNAWTYSPVKYWPNMTPKDPANDDYTIDGQTGNTAYAASSQYVSFYAYAPYQQTANIEQADDPTVPFSAGDIKAGAAHKQYGITNLVTQTTAGVPDIDYVMNPNASASEDLLWATAPLSGISYTAVNGNQVAVTSGLPLLNLVKPDTHTKIKFYFQHALTALRMDLDLAVDQLTKGGKLAEGTRVVVNEITLEPKANPSTQGFAKQGTLKLLNETSNKPEWTDLVKENLSIKAAGGNVNLNAALANVSYDYTLDKYTPALPAPIFDSSIDDVLMFIPVYEQEDDFTVKVTINYDIVTNDANYGAGGEVTVNNVISRDVVLKKFRAGRFYALHLVLGMTSVKIDAEAQDWAIEEQIVDVPRNLD